MTSTRWFRLPTETVTIDGKDYNQPKYADYGQVWRGDAKHPGGAPIWVVRVRGTKTELDTIAGKSGATEISRSNAADALNNMYGENMTADEWEAGMFSI